MNEAYGVFRFTIQETVRKGTLLTYFAIATVIIGLYAFGIKLSADGSAIIFFGSAIPEPRAHITVAEFLLLQLYNGSSSLITLLGLFGTAGLIPSLLEKGTVDLFLSKPITRSNIFLSRCVGALTVIAVNILYFTLGIWMVFGIKLGVWHWGFLATSLVSSYMFGCFFAVAALVGMYAQSAGVAIILAFGVSLLSGALETREVFLYRIWDNTIYHRMLDVLYYITPQLSAMGKSASALISANPFPASVRGAATPQEFNLLPFFYSTLSAGAMYALAILIFRRRDY
jgi:ABC-type transport system involved in multi-copper enzyme maturation permease subunit